MSRKKSHLRTDDPSFRVFLEGDDAPRATPHLDLRNDYAGDEKAQIKSLLPRYLERLPAEELIDIASMAAQMQKHYPLQSVPESDFRSALQDLVKEGWVTLNKDEVAINKAARVAHAYLFSH